MGEHLGGSHWRWVLMSVEPHILWRKAKPWVFQRDHWQRLGYHTGPSTGSNASNTISFWTWNYLLLLSYILRLAHPSLMRWSSYRNSICVFRESPPSTENTFLCHTTVNKPPPSKASASTIPIVSLSHVWRSKFPYRINSWKFWITL